MGALIQMTGKTFGRLLVLHRVGSDRHNKPVFMCRCDCGETVAVRGAHLRGGSVVSCGCFHNEQASRTHTKHGHSACPSRGGRASSEYDSYSSAKARCTNPSDKSYPDYGGRGILFLFPNFQAFLADLGGRPTGLSLDRINNDGHYQVGNVRWATWSQQRLNSRKPRRLRDTARKGIS